MKNKPLISIVVPVHNVEAYIHETLDTILNQTLDFNQFEIILVNDGSSDKSAQIIETYAQKYKNIQSIHLDMASGAAGKPRNIGIDIATGKYLLFADPDDLFELNACELLYCFAEEHDSEVVVGTFSSFYDDVENDDLFKLFDCNVVINANVETHPFYLQIPNNLGAKIYRTDFVKKHNIQFPIYVASQDAYFTTKAYLLSNKLSFIPNKIFKYRIRNDKANPSITERRNLKYFQDFSYIRHLLIDLYNQYPRLNYFDIRYENDLRWLFYQLEHVTDISDETKVEILKEIAWFVHLVPPKFDIINVLTDRRLTLFTKITENAFDEAIHYMNVASHDLFKNI